MTSFDFENELAPRSKEGKKVVYVNPVNMGCAQWEAYRVDIRRRLARGEGVDRLVSIAPYFSFSFCHSPLSVFLLQFMQDVNVGTPIACTSRTPFTSTRVAQLCFPLPPA